jgi:arsenate reductase
MSSPSRPLVVLFACIHNAGRSQLAAALLNHLATPDQARAISAGTQPADQVHPTVLEVLRELGIDLGNIRPQRLTAELAATADLLITMGCGDECPVIPGLRRADWPLPDPKGQPIEKVRALRDTITTQVKHLLASPPTPTEK